MAQTILAAALGASLAGDTWDGLPGNRTSLPDQTATTAVQAFVAPVRVVRAVIALKTFTRGTGTVGPIFEIQMADNAGFTTNVRSIATANTNASATGAIIHFYMNGVVLDNLLAQWCKIKVTFSGTDSGTFDCYLDAA